MKLAHILPILSLIAPIACIRQRPETWPPAIPGGEEKYFGTSKYIRPPPGWKAPSEEEKKAREESILPHRNVVEALEDFMFETTRPRAQNLEQLNLGMLSVHVAVAGAGDGILTLEGPYSRDSCFDLLNYLPKIAEKCWKAMSALDDPTLACSTALSKWEKERLAEKIKDLRLMITLRYTSPPASSWCTERVWQVYDHNFSQRCENAEVGAPSLPLPLVEDIRWHFKRTAELYADIDEYCRSKGLSSSDAGEW